MSKISINENNTTSIEYRDKSQNEIDLIEEYGIHLKAHEIKSAKSFTQSFTKGLDYFRKIVGKDVVSTQVIYDGEHHIISKENGICNFRNINLE